MKKPHIKNIKLLAGVMTLAVITASFVYTRAAFIEPSVAPASSDQDFAQNILGANSADNDFVSDTVTPNGDGSIIERLEYVADRMANRDVNDYVYGRGWIASSSGDASITLSHQACETAANWEWFEDGNGDGDTIDDEDGICVLVTTTDALTWNGMHYSNWRDNTYLAAYTCSGSFPTGVVASYSGIDASGAADNTWNDGDCALCQADCYDGRKDLPDQIGQDGGAYTGEAYGTASHDGPLTSEILKNWKGTRLPTSEDFFGFCGASSGDSDSTAGDSLYYSSGASSDQTLGDYGHNAGRGASAYAEYLDLSNSGGYEWFSEQFTYSLAQVGGYYSCSYVNYYYVYNLNRFRAVFRP